MRLSFCLVLAATAMGCSVAPQAEPQQSSQSKLLAPKALFKAKASESTTEETGITEWRVFKGKRDFVLTGYDSHGKSVGGTAFRFAKEGSQNVLNARVLDGSSFSANYTFGGTAVAGATASPKTQTLFHKAAADMLGIRLALQSQGRGYQGTGAAAGTTANPNLGLPVGLPAGLDPFGGVTNPFGQLGAGCGTDLMSMLMGAMQCMGGVGGLGGATSNPAQLLQCALASQGAASTGATCADSTQLGGSLFDPSGLLGGGAGTGLGAGMDPYGMQDPFGMGMGGAAGMDPTGMGQGGLGIDPNGAGQFDPLGQGDPFGQQGCLSCTGGFDDFGVSGQNGAVGFGQMAGGDQGAEDI